MFTTWGKRKLRERRERILRDSIRFARRSAQMWATWEQILQGALDLRLDLADDGNWEAMIDEMQEARATILGGALDEEEAHVC